MNESYDNERTLAYKTASIVDLNELANVSGGAIDGATGFTTKVTLHRDGGDVGVDASW